MDETNIAWVLVALAALCLISNQRLASFFARLYGWRPDRTSDYGTVIAMASLAVLVFGILWARGFISIL